MKTAVGIRHFSQATHLLLCIVTKEKKVKIRLDSRLSTVIDLMCKHHRNSGKREENFMKKWMSLGLCVLLLLSLTACGGGLACDPLPLPSDEYYVQGMARLEEGNLTEAYDLFKLSANPKAAAELEKFAFVPTTVTRKNSNGRDLVHTFTYDEKGNLLSAVDKGDYSWTMETDSSVTYTYDEMGNLLSQESRYQDEVYRNVYTYDEKGNELTYAYYNTSGNLQNSYTNTYDERGRLAKAEHYDHLDGTQNYTEVFTYDEQDRVLTRTVTYVDLLLQRMSVDGQRRHSRSEILPRSHTLSYRTSKAFL